MGEAGRGSAGTGTGGVGVGGGKGGRGGRGGERDEEEVERARPGESDGSIKIKVTGLKFHTGKSFFYLFLQRRKNKRVPAELNFNVGGNAPHTRCWEALHRRPLRFVHLFSLSLPFFVLFGSSIGCHLR